MPDVEDMLRSLPHAITPGPAGPDVAAADVARGRRALGQRHRRRVAGLGGAVAVVAGLAVVISQPGARTPSAGPPAASTPSAVTRTSAIQLTAYTGAQPAGFQVAAVPAGWTIVFSDDYSFVVAPPGAPAAPGGAAAVPAARAAAAAQSHAGKAHSGTAVSYVGRIVVMLQGMSELPNNEAVTPVTVNGRPGQLGLAGGGNAKTASEWLIYPDGKGHHVLIQVPVSVGLSTGQLVQFANGITVTSAAKAAAG
jgi:hypothetical protein